MRGWGCRKEDWENKWDFGDPSSDASYGLFFRWSEVLILTERCRKTGALFQLQLFFKF
jgi:hypothetical protein